jgi:hypothetical protein
VAQVLRDNKDVTFSLKHIKSVRVAFALLVFFASSGATAVLHTCTLPKMDCCAPASSANHDGCDQSAVPISAPLLQADFTCHTNTFVGGVALKLALAEKENKSQPNKASVVFVLPSPFGISNSVQALSRYLFTLAASHPPSSVEKYVLNASFLI